MHSNFIEIILPRGCSHVNLLHICRTAVLTNIYGKVLLPILLIMPVIFFNTNLCPFLQALTALRITPEFCLRFSNTMCPVYRIEEWHKLAVSSNHRKKMTKDRIRRSWRPLRFMIQNNNTIDKHCMKPMSYCFQAGCRSSILKPPQTMEGHIKLIIEMQTRESKIVYHS